MRSFAILGLLICVGPLTASAEDLDQACPGPSNGTTVRQALEWCSRNSSGFNEGGLCGAQALSGVSIPGVPAQALGYAVIGNSWSRTNMMYLAKDAAKTGAVDAAFNAAVCCQRHTPWASACLANSRQAVEQWLRQP